MMFCSKRNNVHLSKNSCKVEVFLKLNDVAVSDPLLLDPSLPFEWDSIYKRPFTSTCKDQSVLGKDRGCTQHCKSKTSFERWKYKTSLNALKTLSIWKLCSLFWSSCSSTRTCLLKRWTRRRRVTLMLDNYQVWDNWTWQGFKISEALMLETGEGSWEDKVCWGGANQRDELMR